jgi:hypothetical protein
MKCMKLASDAVQKAILTANLTDHNLPDPPYPKGQARRALCLLRRLLHSFRRRWERRPGNEKRGSQLNNMFCRENVGRMNV